MYRQMERQQAFEQSGGNFGRKESSASSDLASPDNIADLNTSFFNLQVLFDPMIIHIGPIVPRDSFIRSVWDKTRNSNDQWSNSQNGCNPNRLSQGSLRRIGGNGYDGNIFNGNQWNQSFLEQDLFVIHQALNT